ncbi:hypothetical protein BGZ83_003295, partial [Gryganskiella cystojenkinii]
DQQGTSRAFEISSDPKPFQTVESPVFVKVRQADSRVSPLALPARRQLSEHLAAVTQQTSQFALAMPQDQSSRQEQDGHPPLPRMGVPKKNRPRYSFKRQDRSTMKERPPPQKMKQYVWKPFVEPEPKPDKPKQKPKPKPKPKQHSESTALTTKLTIKRMLSYHHPTISLHMGMLSNDIKEAVPDDTQAQQEIKSVLERAACEAARVKREA